ncbi:SIR2 family protein [Desulfosporosinus sp. SB140]|uniref:SIR2 family protein n=1 Tax=Desulfosporosinus paludis TaxID=3115649 RepID=UPI00388CFF75
MELQDFIKNLTFENNSVRSYILFETLVLKLLSKYLDEQSKIIIFDNDKIKKDSTSRIGIYDGLIPEGIDELPGPTAVEIKFYRNIKSNLSSLKNTIASIINDVNIKSLLLIIGTRLSEKDKNLIMNNREKTIVEIWDFDKLSVLWNMYSEYVNDIVPNLSEIMISNIVSNSINLPSNEWKIKRDQLLKELKESYQKDDLVLFLGAGVSRKAGVPDWGTLVSDLLVNMISDKLGELNVTMNEQEQEAIIQEIKSSNDSSPLLQARYIRTGLEKSFFKVLTRALYKNFNQNNYGTSDLLKSISRLCIPPRNGIGIKAVVTYNFDDLIEINLEKGGVSHRTIYREMDIASQDELGIYHVHGFLPRENQDLEISPDNLLVFSEEGYHSLFLDPYSWLILCN